MEPLDFSIAADVKMCKFYKYLYKEKVSDKYFLVMILVGKASGKPKFGCPFCSAFTPFLERGDLYTLQDLIKLNEVI